MLQIYLNKDLFSFAAVAPKKPVVPKPKPVVPKPKPAVPKPAVPKPAAVPKPKPPTVPPKPTVPKPVSKPPTAPPTKPPTKSASAILVDNAFAKCQNTADPMQCMTDTLFNNPPPLPYVPPPDL